MPWRIRNATISGRSRCPANGPCAVAASATVPRSNRPIAAPANVVSLKRLDQQAGVAGDTFPNLSRWDLAMREDGEAQAGVGVKRIDSLVREVARGKTGQPAVLVEEVQLRHAVPEKVGLEGVQPGNLVHSFGSFPYLNDRCYYSI